MCEPSSGNSFSWLEHFDEERLSHAAAAAFEIKFSKSCALLLTQVVQKLYIHVDF
jgi:hypothetical protein